jgi:hypothetical protein
MMMAPELLPDLIKEKVGMHVKLSHWLGYVEAAGDATSFYVRNLSAVTANVKKWGGNLERLFSRRRSGMPEAEKMWTGFITDAFFLIAHRYMHDALPVFCLVDPKTPLAMTKLARKNFILRLPPYTENVGRLTVRRYASMICDNCRKCDVTLRWCDGCKGVKYCSPACQRQAWTQHKPVCKAAAQAKLVAATTNSKQK